MILCEWDASEGHPGQSCVHLYPRILLTSFTSVSIFSVWCYSSVSISMCTTVTAFNQSSWSHMYMWVWGHVQYIRERVQRRYGMNCKKNFKKRINANWFFWAFYWREVKIGFWNGNNRKVQPGPGKQAFSQIIKDCFYLPFFLLIILCTQVSTFQLQ